MTEGTEIVLYFAYTTENCHYQIKLDIVFQKKKSK